MKFRYVAISLALILIIATIALRIHHPNYAPQLAAYASGESTFVSPPTAMAQQIETLATDSIITSARAGTETHAFYTDYGKNYAIGYLTYDGYPKLVASFVANKDIFGHWHITNQKHGLLGTPAADQ